MGLFVASPTVSSTRAAGGGSAPVTAFVGTGGTGDPATFPIGSLSTASAEGNRGGTGGSSRSDSGVAATIGGRGGTGAADGAPTSNKGGSNTGGSAGNKGGSNTGGTTSNKGGAAGGSNVGGTVEAGCSTLLTKMGEASGDICSISTTTADTSSINVLIALDKSSSMRSDSFNDASSKWDGVTSALADALNTSDSSVRYGLLLYPYASPVPASVCELAPGEGAVNIQVGPATETIPQMIQLMHETVPAGGTPTAAALASAYKYYVSGAGKNLNGEKYVLLVTDGGPNCNPDIACGGETCTANMDRSGNCGTGIENCCDPSFALVGGGTAQLLCLDDTAVSTQIKALHSQGIKTFVVGIPGTEAYASYLDRFAESGGLPATPTVDTPHKYYAVKNQAELTTAFRNITASLVRNCVVPLAAKASDPTRLNVAVDCEALPQSSTGTVHWEYDANSQSIEIEGSACDRIKTQGVRRIAVITGCPTLSS